MIQKYKIILQWLVLISSVALAQSVLRKGLKAKSAILVPLKCQEYYKFANSISIYRINLSEDN
jgi:hypothetical protein